MPEVRVCGRGDVEPGTARRFAVGGGHIVLVRIGDELFALDDCCSHADASLAGGEVWTDECEIECPKHGSAFSLRTGAPLTLPATVPVATYPVRVDGDDVLVSVPGDDGEDG